MTRADQTEIRMRICIESPVAGVLYSLQSKDGHPLEPKRATLGKPLVFDFSVRIAPGAKFFGDQVRREGPLRRFVYIRIGQSAGDHASPWSRRMKVDIHDIEAELLADAASSARAVEITVNGTGRDGSPACATVPIVRRRVI